MATAPKFSTVLPKKVRPTRPYRLFFFGMALFAIAIVVFAFVPEYVEYANGRFTVSPPARHHPAVLGNLPLCACPGERSYIDLVATCLSGCVRDPILLGGFFAILHIEPASVATGREARRIRREVRFNRAQRQAAFDNSWSDAGLCKCSEIVF